MITILLPLCYGDFTMDSSILLTKMFIPSLPHEIIHRHHLPEGLTAGLNAGKSLTLVSAPAGYGKSTLIAEWITAHQDQAIFVLDDYHVISNSDIHAGMNFLLEHMPPAFHLVIASRTDPPLPLGRLRMRGQMTEVRVSDLRFDIDDASSFLNEVMGSFSP